MNYANSRSLSTAYDNRLRPTTWNVSNVLGYNYNYDYFNEHTGRVTYAGSIYDASLDRSYEYDNAGRLAISHTGAEARAAAWTGQWGTMDGPYSQGYDYDVWGNVTHKYGWGGEVQGGGAGQSSDIYYSYTNNRRNGFTYDAAGNLTNDLGQNFTYDVTGQQTNASYGGYSLVQSYDGDGLRVKKNDNGWQTYYLRSSVLGGQVVAEIIWASVSWQWNRGYVYLGSQLLAVQQNGVYFVHEDAITKSKRITNMSGAIQSTIELDPWGADTNRSSNSAFQPKKFTSYERDANGTDEAMFRRYNRWQSRFDQPDPYDGSYSLTNPQSFNRYAYVQGDPVNFVDPTGLFEAPGSCGSYAQDPVTKEWVWIPCSGSTVTVHGGGDGGSDPFDDPFFTGYDHWDIVLPVVPITRELIPLIEIPQKLTPPQSKPLCVHSNSGGSADINGTLNPFALGYTGGLVVTANQVQPYGGMVLGTPNRAASLMVNTHDDITPGLNYSIAGGFIIGVSWSGKLDPNNILSSLKAGSLRYGGTTPGVGVAVTYAPKILQFSIPCL